MKYGIQLIAESGDVKYVTSTRRFTLSEDISELATFVQEKSAVDAVKALRKDGKEPSNETFAVIGVELLVKSITSVPRPPAKVGFAITNKGQWFSGTKKPNEYDTMLYRFFGNFERATTFTTSAAAEERMAMIRTSAQAALQKLVDTPDYKWQGRWTGNSIEEAREMKEREVSYAQLQVDELADMKIVTLE